MQSVTHELKFSQGLALYSILIYNIQKMHMMLAITIHPCKIMKRRHWSVPEGAASPNLHP